MELIRYWIIPLNTPTARQEAIIRKVIADDCASDRTAVLWSREVNKGWYRRIDYSEHTARGRITLPTFDSIPQAELLLSMGMPIKEILEILNE